MKENPSKTHLSDKNLTKEDTLKYEDLDASYKKQAIKAIKQMHYKTYVQFKLQSNFFIFWNSKLKLKIRNSGNVRI